MKIFYSLTQRCEALALWMWPENIKRNSCNRI